MKEMWQELWIQVLVGKIPGEGTVNPLQCSYLENPMDSSQGCKRVGCHIVTKQQQWLIHIVEQQKPTHYKAIILQLKILKKLTHCSHIVNFFSVDTFRTRSGLIDPNLNPH